MPKFFIQNQIAGNETKIEIHNEDFKHIRDVLRMKTGENIVICDSIGMDHNCIIESFETDFVVTRILSRMESNNEPPFEIIVYQGLPKADKMEVIVQKCVELGVYSIVPVSCKRSIVKLTDKKDVEKKVQRWNKIAYEAAKQCNRSTIPSIQNPVNFKEALNQILLADVAFIPWECEDDNSLKTLLKKASDLLANRNTNINSNQTNGANETNQKNQTIAFIIGPEGGFDQGEIMMAKQMGIATVTLGKRVLRTETVAPAVLAMILFETEL